MHRDTLDYTRIIHKDINLTDLLMNLFNESLDSHLVGNVTDITFYIGYTRLGIIGEPSFEGRLIYVVENNVLDTGCNKCFRNVETNSVRCACYPSVLSFKRKKICHNYLL